MVVHYENCFFSIKELGFELGTFLLLGACSNLRAIKPFLILTHVKDVIKAWKIWAADTQQTSGKKWRDN